LPTPPDSNDKVNFRVRADAFLSKLPIFADKLNTYAREANSLKDEMNNIRDETNSYKNETLNYKNVAYGYKVAAEDAANEIKSYVIPDGTTYSKDEIDNQLSEITRVQVAQQIILSYLQQN
jgi:hypothetical protein